LGTSQGRMQMVRRNLKGIINITLGEGGGKKSC
jgi:hypothetical protein